MIRYVYMYVYRCEAWQNNTISQIWAKIPSTRKTLEGFSPQGFDLILRQFSMNWSMQPGRFVGTGLCATEHA